MSGQGVQCECGQRLEAPPLRELTRLPVAPSQAAVRTGSWDFRKGMMLFGLSLAVLAGGFGAYWRHQANVLRDSIDPNSPSQAFVKRQIDQMTWKDLRKGLYIIPNTERLVAGQQEDFALLIQWAGWGLAAIGLIVCVLGGTMVSGGTRKVSSYRD